MNLMGYGMASRAFFLLHFFIKSSWACSKDGAFQLGNKKLWIILDSFRRSLDQAAYQEIKEHGN